MIDTVVIKVGGSLLSEAGAPATIAGWLEATRRDEQRRLLVVGGGAGVEALRRIDAANPLSAAAAHWGAIGYMDAHATLLADWCGAVVVASRIPEAAGDYVVQPGGWLRTDEPHQPGAPLRVSWATTSDAIAARLAAVLGARLVVLKHSLARPYRDLAEAAEAGVVDPETPRQGPFLAEVELFGVIRPGLPPAGTRTADHGSRR